MHNSVDNPFAPPMATLDQEGSLKPRPLLCALGVISGIPVGIIGIVAYMLVADIMFLLGLILLVITTIVLVSFWRKRLKNLNRTANFSLGILIALSVFQVLAILVMLLRTVPNDRKANASLTHRSTRTLPLRVIVQSFRAATAAPVNSIR